jgi:DNA-binding MarR family transcriptional regulator
LEKLGYIRKTRASGDGRSTVVSLTPKGKRLRPTFERVSGLMLDLIYSGMAREQEETLIVGLEQVFENLLTYFELPRQTSNREKGLERRIE